MRWTAIAFAFWMVAAVGAAAAPLTGSFASIDGGEYRLEDWRGRPVLVVNTASRCAFTPQYDDLQALYDRYREQGLVVLAVPSNDFRQELDSEAAVKEFCEVNFALDLPMTEILAVTGPEAHPFYARVHKTAGFAPRWNFNKILIGPDGDIVATWGSMVRPTSDAIAGRIEALLGGS